MATATTATTGPSNINAIKQAVFDEARNCGRTYGKGKTARLKLAEIAVARSRDGTIGVDDAEQMWSEMMQGSAEETKSIGGDDPKDTKQRAGDLKNFILLGGLKDLDGVELFDNAQRLMANLRSAGSIKNARVWELMLAFARKQLKEPQRSLTDGEIEKVMADKARATTDFVEKVDASRRALLAANEGENDPEVYTAIEILEGVVKKLGGTRKQRMELARQEAKKLLEAAAGGSVSNGKSKGKKKGSKDATAAAN